MSHPGDSKGPAVPVGAAAGSWYEPSIAAGVLGITEKELKRRLKNNDPTVHKERNQRQPAPFKGWFVYVAGNSGNAAMSSIGLTEWLLLCSLLDEEKKVSFGAKEKDLYCRYTGSWRIDIEEMRASNRFISPQALKKLLEGKTSSKGANDSRGGLQSDSAGGSGQSQSETQNNVAASATNTANNNPTQPTSASNARAASSSSSSAALSSSAATAKTSSQPRPLRQCVIGLGCARVSNCQDKAYCLERWEYCKGAWRSRHCLMSTDSEKESADHKLWNPRNQEQCMKCYNAKGNIIRDRNPELWNADGAGGGSGTQGLVETPAPSSNDNLVRGVVDTYGRLLQDGNAAEKIKEDQLVRENMMILQGRGVSSILLGDGNKILMCPGIDAMEGRCRAVEVVRVQSNNADCCDNCRRKKNQINRRERSREENRERRIDPTSKVPKCHLRSDELQEMHKKANLNRKVAARKAKEAEARLAKALKVEVVEVDPMGAGDDDDNDDMFKKQHKSFMEATKKALSYASAAERREQFKELIETTLLEVLREGVKNEKNDPSIEFKEEDVADMVQLIAENMDNALQDLSGKPGQKRHSLLSYQIAWTQFKRSKAGYREGKLYSPLSAPHERELGRLKSISKIKDGNDAKLYEMRLRTKKERAASVRADEAVKAKARRGAPGSASSPAASGAASRAEAQHPVPRPPNNDETIPPLRRVDDHDENDSDSSAQTFDPMILEHGILMVDEMKVKHGMVFNSNTLEPLGMADDDLDLKSVMRGVLDGSGDFAKPAVYVSQWRYKDFTTNEAWNCSYFFNDGSCSGETLLRQMTSVILSCEGIGSKVFGICMDAGGNNARLIRITRRGKTLTDIDASWIDENLCYILNEYDPSRRIYLYFCLTHQLKAMRNQLLASVIGGAKAFKDEHGISFGFALIRKVQKRVAQFDDDVDFLPRITENVAFPTKYSKMSVSDAKKIFEIRTLSYLEEYFCTELGIDKADLNVDEESLVSKYIEEDGKGSPTQKHGRMFYRAKVLMSIALSRRASDTAAPDATTAAKTGPSGNDRRGVQPVEPTASQEGDPTSSIGHSTAEPSVRQATNAGALPVSEELLSDISTYQYLTAVGALFNGMLSDTEERFNKQNVGPYTTFLKDVMSYFGDWRDAQQKRKKKKEEDWKESFLDQTTYNNLRSAVCGFSYFAAYVLEHVSTFRREKLYVPMMCGNQTSLEGYFSVVRGSDNDTSVNYGSNINSDATTSAISSMKKSSYDYADRGAEKGGGVISGMTSYATYHRNRGAVLDRWRATWKDRCDSNTSCTRFPVAEMDESTLKSTHSEGILEKMKDVPVKNHHSVAIFETESFQSWKRLSIGTPHEAFFDKIVLVPDSELDPLCQKVHLMLFGFIDAFITNSTDTETSFESQLLCYLASDDFDKWQATELPTAIRGDRFGAVILVRTLAEIHESWFFRALKELFPRPPSDDSTDGRDLTPMQVHQLIHRFVGAAVRVCLVKFRKSGAINKYGKVATDHAKQILHTMRLASLSDAMSDADYMENYYPTCIQHFNQGGLSLLRKELFAWATNLIRSVWSSLTNSVITTYKRDSIKQAAKHVYGNEAIPREFIASFKALPCAPAAPDEALKVVHQAMVKYVFLAYAGMRWDNQFGDPKKASGSKHNVSHRTNLQCTNGSGGGSHGQGRGKKRSRSRGPNQEIVALLRGKVGGAIKLLRANDNVVVTEGKNRLSRNDMASLLWICYNDYKPVSSNTVTKLKDFLSKAIQSDSSKLELAEKFKAPVATEGVNGPQKQQKIDKWNAGRALDSLTRQNNGSDSGTSSKQTGDANANPPDEVPVYDGEESVAGRVDVGMESCEESDVGSEDGFEDPSMDIDETDMSFEEYLAQMPLAP